MDVEEDDVELAPIAVEFAEQQVRHQQTADDEESVDGNRAVANGLEPPSHHVLYARDNYC